MFPSKCSNCLILFGATLGPVLRGHAWQVLGGHVHCWVLNHSVGYSPSVGLDKCLNCPTISLVPRPLEEESAGEGSGGREITFIECRFCICKDQVEQNSRETEELGSASDPVTHSW